MNYISITELFSISNRQDANFDLLQSDFLFLPFIPSHHTGFLPNSSPFRRSVFGTRFLSMYNKLTPNYLSNACCAGIFFTYLKIESRHNIAEDTYYNTRAKYIIYYTSILNTFMLFKIYHCFLLYLWNTFLNVSFKYSTINILQTNGRDSFMALHSPYFNLYFVLLCNKFK